LSTSEITADRVFTSYVAWACCKLWLLGLNRQAAHAQPCGNRHKESRDSQARHFPAGFF
jgi:hypothetical protein